AVADKEMFGEMNHELPFNGKNFRTATTSLLRQVSLRERGDGTEPPPSDATGWGHPWPTAVRRRRAAPHSPSPRRRMPLWSAAHPHRTDRPAAAPETPPP